MKCPSKYKDDPEQVTKIFRVNFPVKSCIISNNNDKFFLSQLGSQNNMVPMQTVRNFLLRVLIYNIYSLSFHQFI